MTTTVDGQPPDDPANDVPVRPGIGELIVAGLVAAIAVFLLVGTAVMEVPEASGFLGPRFFPGMVGIFLMVMSVVLTAQIWWRSHRDQVSGTEGTSLDSAESGIDWKPLGMIVGALLLHVLLLDVLGWIVAGALLFWCVSYALGGRQIVRDLGIAFIVSSATQLGFSAGLGLSLPSGILVGVI